MTVAPRWQRHWPLSALAALLVLLALWAMLAPLRGGSQVLLLAFPPGVQQRGLALPAEIRLTRGVQDVLLLHNLDRVPVVFGPLTLAPGRALRLPFEEEGVHDYTCPVVLGGSVRIRLVPAPAPGWTRLRWRLDRLHQAIRYLPLRPPDP